MKNLILLALLGGGGYFLYKEFNKSKAVAYPYYREPLNTSDNQYYGQDFNLLDFGASPWLDIVLNPSSNLLPADVPQMLSPTPGIYGPVKQYSTSEPPDIKKSQGGFL